MTASSPTSASNASEFSRSEGSSGICLSLQNVSISYGSNEAVRGVYMDIPRGKVTAFIGPSVRQEHGAARSQPDE